MATPVNMPQVGQDLETARINEWHVKQGDKVNEGDILATVESDKASFEVEASASGVVIQLLFNAGDEAAVFKPIAFIGNENEILTFDKPTTLTTEPAKISATEPLFTSHEIKSSEKLFISPAARRVAKENNISLEALKATATHVRLKKKHILSYIQNGKHAFKTTPLARKIIEDTGLNAANIEGSGYNNRIMKRDLTPYLGMPRSKTLEPAAGDQVFVFGKIRKRIAERLSFSKHTIPHYYLFAEADVSSALDYKENIFTTTGNKISINDIIIKATAEALVDFPSLNAWVDDEKMIIKPDINIGVAVSTEDGLLVPVIPSANKLNVKEIHYFSRKNAEDAKRGIVQVKNPGTFTITNLGMYGISRFLPIINPPECAILSLGAVEKKVVVRNNAPAVADIITLGLACDHRAVDGAKAALFLGKLKDIIENFSKQ